jgi:hypothetical protein
VDDEALQLFGQRNAQAPCVAPRDTRTDVDVADYRQFVTIPRQSKRDYISRAMMRQKGAVEPRHRITADECHRYQGFAHSLGSESRNYQIARTTGRNRTTPNGERNVYVYASMTLA